jgi:hypothetical protein
MRLRHIAIFGLSVSTAFFLPYLLIGTIGKRLLKRNMFLFSLKLLSETVLILKNK